MLPAWADVLIVAAIPVILLTVLKFMGDGTPDNAVVHHSDDEPPDTGEGPDEVLQAA
jgi:hypothetical protein